MATDLAPDDVTERRNGDSKSRQRQKRGEQMDAGEEKEQRRADDAEGKREANGGCLRFSGRDGDAILARWRQARPVPDHGCAAESSDGEHGQPGPGGRKLRQDGGKCGNTKAERQDEGDGAVGADAAVLHDEEGAFPIPAATEAIGGVCEPILMESAGYQRLNGDDREGCEQRVGFDGGEDGGDGRRWQDDQQTRQRKGAHSAAEAAIKADEMALRHVDTTEERDRARSVVDEVGRLGHGVPRIGSQWCESAFAGDHATATAGGANAVA